MAISWNEVGAKKDDWGAPKITKTAATLQKAQQNYYAQAQKEEEERRANNRQIMTQIENEATANRITGIPTAKAGSTLIGTPGIASVAVGMAEKKEEQRQTAIIGTAARLEKAEDEYNKQKSKAQTSYNNPVQKMSATDRAAQAKAEADELRARLETLGVTEKEAKKTLKESQKGEGTWLGKTAASAATDTASGYLGGLGGVFGVLESAAMGFKKVSDEDRKAAADILRADATKQQYTVTQLQRQLNAAQPGSAEHKQLSKQLREAQKELQRKNSLLANAETFVSEAARETANKLQTKSAEQKQAAYEKTGNTKFGKIATDVTSAGLGMVFDAAAGLATGITPLTSAAIRAAGSANLEAKNEGATEASAAVRGGLEFLKVSMVGRLSNVSGIAQKFTGTTGGRIDDAVNVLIGRLASSASSNPAIQKGLNYLFNAIASGAGEGAEEMIEDVLDPALDAISRLDAAQLKQLGSGEFWLNVMYDGLVGAIMGLAGGALDVGNIKTPESVTETAKTVSETAKTVSETPETVSQSKTQPMGDIQTPAEAKTAQTGEIQAKADEFNALVREYSNRLETAKNEGYDAAELKWLQDTEAELTRRRAELDELQKNKTTPEVGAEIAQMEAGKQKTTLTNRGEAAEVVKGNIIKIDDEESANPTSLATGGGAGTRSTSSATDSSFNQPRAGESRQGGIGEAPSADANVSQQGGEVNGKETSGSGYGTKAIQKLGININKPLAGYDFVESAVSNEKAARRAIRDLNRKMNELNPTAKEKRIAEGLADGTFDEADIPASVNKNKVLELADYIAQKDSFDEKKLKYRKEDMKFEFEDKLDKLFEHEATWKKRNAGALKLNTNTMERNFLNVAGDADGKALNEELYYPVVENEAERIRFVNRMFDRVRDFHLSKNESELVQLVIEGRAAGDIMAKLPPNEQTTLKAAAEGSIEDFPELSSQQKKIVEDYKRWLDTQARVDSPDVDADKVNKAADAYSAAYAEFYTAINDFLVAHGYEPIGFIKGYAPHMQTEETKTGIAKLLDRLGVGMEVTELPTEIAGRTESFKPGKQWNPHFLPRMGDKTVYDAVSGYENYVNYISNVFYHTDDIQKLRITSNYLRDRYATDEIRERISQARYMLKQNASVQNEYLKDMKVIERGTQLSADDARAKILEYIDSQWTDRKNLTKYGDFVSVLDDYANVLAGKQTKLDRSFESFFGRNILNVGRKIEQTFAKSSVVGNLSSALNQTAQLPMLMSEVGVGNTYQAIWDIVRGELNKVNFDTQSDFITGKQQIDYLKDAEGFEKVLDAAAIPFNAVDDFASRLVVRAKYLEQVKQGKTHEQAIKEADRYANRLIGSRLKGAKPIVFESKNPLVKLVTTFQLEIANGWAHISQDMPRSVKEIAKTKGTKAAAAAVGGILAKYLITAFLANRLSEDIYGGTPAPYDIVGLALSSFAAAYGVSPNEYLKTIADDVLEKVTGERGFGAEELGEADINAGLEELRYNALGDVPYLNNVLSLLDLSDSRLPLPKLTDSAFKSGKAQLEAAETPEERAAALYNMGAGAFNIATSWLPLGNQIKKTAQGAELIARGGKYSNYGENEQLNYPVDFSGVGGALTGIKALLFGPNSLSQAEEYWSTDKRKLTATQTDAFQGAVNAGADKETAYSLIDKMRGAEKTDTQSAAQVKSRMLQAADIPGLAKGSIYYFTLANDKEKALMDAFSESGADIGEVTNTLIEIKNAEDSNSKRYYIAEATLTDEEKQEIYTALISDTHGDDIYRILSSGLSFNDYLFIQNEYTDINNRNLSAANKTLAFERWIDSEGFNKRQEQAIQNSFKFYSMTVADTEGKYDELTELGIGSDTAEQIIKKASIYDTTTTAEKVKFYREIINLVKGSSQQLKALTPYLSEGDLNRCTYATDAGISTAEWVTFKEEMLGRSTQAQTKAVLDSMVYLTNKERAVLWQMQNKSWKPSSNPYDYTAGKAAYDYMHEED